LCHEGGKNNCSNTRLNRKKWRSPTTIWLPVSLWAAGMFSCIARGEESGKPVTLDEARTVATRMIRRATRTFPQWDGAVPGEHAVFRDLSGKPTAVVFEVTSAGRSLGFVTVAGSRNHSPALHSSACPFPIREIERRRRAVEGTIGLTKGGIELFYLGGPEYWVRFSSANSNRNAVIGLRSGFTLNFQALQERDHWYQSIGHRGATEAEARWTRFLSEPSIEPRGEDLQYNEVPGVPFYSWYRGCGPTSLSMVMNFHGLQGRFVSHSVSSFPWDGPDGVDPD